MEKKKEASSSATRQPIHVGTENAKEKEKKSEEARAKKKGWNVVSKIQNPTSFIMGCVEKWCFKFPLMIHVLLVMVLVWILGSCQFDFWFTICASLFYLYHVHRVQTSFARKRMKRELEEEFNRMKSFTDDESLAWFNTFVEQAWPVWLESMLNKILLESLQPTFDYYCPPALKKIAIQKLRLGSSPLFIHSAKVLKVHDKRHRAENQKYSDEIFLELDCSFIASEDMGLTVAGITKSVGVSVNLFANNLRIEGKLRLGLTFVPYFPYVNTLKVSFTHPPYIDFSIRPLTKASINILDLPGVKTFIDNIIKESLKASFVEPKFMVYDMPKMFNTEFATEERAKVSMHLMKDGHVKFGKHAEVAYVVFEVIEGKNLPPKDSNGLSDPYVKLKLHNLSFQSTVKAKTLNPVWNEFFRLHIERWDTGNILVLKVRDHDTFSSDDKIGYANIDLATFRNKGRVKQWVPLRPAIEKNDKNKLKPTFSLTANLNSIQAQISEQHEKQITDQVTNESNSSWKAEILIAITVVDVLKTSDSKNLQSDEIENDTSSMEITKISNDGFLQPNLKSVENMNLTNDDLLSEHPAPLHIPPPGSSFKKFVPSSSSFTSPEILSPTSPITSNASTPSSLPKPPFQRVPSKLSQTSSSMAISSLPSSSSTSSVTTTFVATTTTAVAGTTDASNSSYSEPPLMKHESRGPNSNTLTSTSAKRDPTETDNTNLSMEKNDDEKASNGISFSAPLSSKHERKKERNSSPFNLNDGGYELEESEKKSKSFKPLKSLFFKSKNHESHILKNSSNHSMPLPRTLHHSTSGNSLSSFHSAENSEKEKMEENEKVDGKHVPKKGEKEKALPKMKKKTFSFMG